MAFAELGEKQEVTLETMPMLRQCRWQGGACVSAQPHLDE
jgi:hypothetical protein